jgi:hypothetical protein
MSTTTARVLFQAHTYYSGPELPTAVSRQPHMVRRSAQPTPPRQRRTTPPGTLETEISSIPDIPIWA